MRVYRVDFVDADPTSIQVQFHYEVGFLQHIHALYSVVHHPDLCEVTVHSGEQVLLGVLARHYIYPLVGVQNVHLTLTINIKVYQMVHVIP